VTSALHPRSPPAKALRTLGDKKIRWSASMTTPSCWRREGRIPDRDHGQNPYGPGLHRRVRDQPGSPRAAKRKAARRTSSTPEPAEQPGQGGHIQGRLKTLTKSIVRDSGQVPRLLMRQPPRQRLAQNAIRRVDTYSSTWIPERPAPMRSRASRSRRRSSSTSRRRTAWLHRLRVHDRNWGTGRSRMLGTTWSPFSRPGREPDRSDLAKAVLGDPRTRWGHHQRLDLSTIAARGDNGPGHPLTQSPWPETWR